MLGKRSENTTPNRAATSRELADFGASGWFGLRGFLRERRALLANPQLAVEDPDSLIKDSSLAFALKAMLIPTVAAGMLGWVLVVFAGLPAEMDEDAAMAKSLRAHRDSLSGYVAALQRDSALLIGSADEITDRTFAAITNELVAARQERARLEPRIVEHEDLADVAAFAPLEWALDNLLIPFLIIMPALFFRGTLTKTNSQYARVAVADRAYVYIVMGRTFVPTSLVVIGDFVVGVIKRYGAVTADTGDMWLSGVWLIGGAWQIVEIGRSVGPLSTALALPRDATRQALIRAVAIFFLIMSAIATAIELIPE